MILKGEELCQEALGMQAGDVAFQKKSIYCKTWVASGWKETASCKNRQPTIRYPDID